MIPALTIVIPARNAAGCLDGLLASLLPQMLLDDHCVVVDDASTDATAAIAAASGVAVISRAGRGGPAAARNLGARHASGDVLVFLDSDLTPAPDLLARLRDHFDRNPGLHAVFGAYDEHPSATSTVSRFRNLLHCYTHRRANPDAWTFWAGCGAIRRAEFERLGGFDAARFQEPSVEDIDLGVRLKRRGGSIRLDPALQVRHNKRWTFFSMLRADLLYRAIPWSNLILESGEMPRDLNLKIAQRVSAIAVAASAAALAVLPWAPVAGGAVAVAGLTAATALNVGFYRFLAGCGGPAFAARCIPLHWVYFLSAVAGFAIAWTRFTARRMLPGRREYDKISQEENRS